MPSANNVINKFSYTGAGFYLVLFYANKSKEYLRKYAASKKAKYV